MPDIQFTERAVQKIHQIASSDSIDLEETMLRVAVIPGGCSGLTYDLGWDTTEQEGDRVFHVDGLRVVLDKRSFLYVSGSELDFSEGLEGKGFHFMNPQATRTCACGDSFGL